MAVVINPAGIEALLQSPGIAAEIAAKTEAIYENAFTEICNIIPQIRGSQITNPLAKAVMANEGIVYLHENNYSGTKKSAAKFLGEKQLNPKEGTGKGWFTKAILGEDPNLGLIPTGFVEAE